MPATERKNSRRPPRVGIVGLLQESNTFVSGRTGIDRFREDLFLAGEEIRARMAGAPHEVGGFFEGLATAGLEAVPLFLARAIPYAVIEAAAFDTLVGRLLSELQSAGPLDAILAAPHGATVAENHLDADGFWLSEVRRVVGPSVPIIATIDPHANLSPAMVAATDALIVYATNPHLDQRDTGIEAAALVARALRGEVRPVQAAAFPPMAINIRCQETSVAPLRGLYEAAAAIVGTAGECALSHSIVLGFPYADVPEMGSAALVVTDGDRPLAESLANRIGDEMWVRRREFEPPFTSPADAVDDALASRDTPVVLLDMGDNVGGGSPGDGTVLLTHLHTRRAAASFVCLCDPAAAEAAGRAGAGAEITLSVGAKTDRLHGDPFTARFAVRSLHDGTFTETEARHGGFTVCDQGPTAILETADSAITVMLTSRRMPPFSIAQLTACGLDPRSMRIIVAKGVIAPMAAYRAIASRFIHVDTPGVTRADMTQLPYARRRKPMFPFEEK